LTTRWRGGIGGVCGARNDCERSFWRAWLDSAHGSASNTEMLPEAGCSAQARVCSKLVLPAPDGPINAICSPCRIDSVMPRKAKAASGAPAWRTQTSCKR